MYDVMVIGAGPAGCMAAKRLADAGYGVLLVERMSIPREKSCSGILIKKSIKVIKNEFGKIPDSVLCKPNISKGIVITNEKGQTFKFESDGLNVWRSLFDEWLALKAQNAGAELRQSTSAIACAEKHDYVSVKLHDSEIYEEKARIVVACDGADSNIKRDLFKKPKNYVFTYQTFCRGTIDLDHDFFHAFLDPQLSQYDAWFNVKDDLLILGVGVKEPALMKMYHSRFLSFLNSQFNAKIESCVKEEVGIMPGVTSGCPVNLGTGRILFAGEAANFLNPIGEGISSALASGYAAAEAVKSAYKTNNFSVKSLIDTYNYNISPEKEYMTRQWTILAGMSSKFSYMK
ncbi:MULTISPECIES: NAD(P)/FAD-dependent oxidoreductase [Methanobacterium]|uniref:Fumarate reductase n=1 Tax=Methanobacterium bryantii TaxID=2161 RepID=A0A2A2HAE8_METBR|nr:MULTISPECIES: NAD(P)/FAD-dependent oxidoreductase [Methanobacterium]OEC85293.1 fumarate reductase [Methanobacterium sp. A39]PAV06260.1 fumarate reductase [Methanobacterium bryantii]